MTTFDQYSLSELPTPHLKYSSSDNHYIVLMMGDKTSYKKTNFTFLLAADIELLYLVFLAKLTK